MTYDGKSLLSYTRRILWPHDEAVASLTGPDLKGLIRLGAPDEYASQHLHEILMCFALQYSPVRVDLSCELSNELLTVFHQGWIYRQWASELLDKKRIIYRIAYSSPSIAGILAAVKSGFAVAPVRANPTISGYRLLPDEGLPKLPSAVVTMYQSVTHGHPSDIQTCLAKYIIEEFQSMPPIPWRPRMVK